MFIFVKIFAHKWDQLFQFYVTFGSTDVLASVPCFISAFAW